jgi:hypothetical protein
MFGPGGGIPLRAAPFSPLSIQSFHIHWILPNCRQRFCPGRHSENKANKFMPPIKA